MRFLTLVAFLVVLPGFAYAQNAPKGGWVDVNFLNLRSAQDAQTYVFSAPVAGEIATAGTAYPKLPSGPALGLDAAVRRVVADVAVEALAVRVALEPREVRVEVAFARSGEECAERSDGDRGEEASERAHAQYVPPATAKSPPGVGAMPR